MNCTYSNKFYKNKKKQNLMKIFMIFLIGIILASFQVARTEFRADKLMDTHVSVEEVVAELQFTVYSSEEWHNFFSDYKEAYITRGMVYDILAKLGTTDVILFNEVGKQKPIEREEWNAIYAQLVDYLDIENQVSIKNILVLASEERELSNSIHTSGGTFFTTLPVTYFSEWASYDVYMLGTECVGVIGESETEHIISNTYLISSEENTLIFLFDKKIYEKKANLNGQSIAEGVADIAITKGEITAIAQKKDYIEGHLLSYDDTTIEIEGYGRVAHGGRIPVYRSYESVEELQISDIILGNMDVKYIIGENEVCAILITVSAEVSRVRVLLLNEDGGNFRENVFLASDGAMTVSCGETRNVVSAGTMVEAKNYLTEAELTLVLSPASGNNLIYLYNENGKRISNGYSGNIEVRQYENGYCVVNEVDFETYLYSVVPSEMPSNYQPEALKAQAVCARSYAYIQVMRSDLAAYGAHINDSSSYQVYNNIAKTQASIQAVNETAGMVMLHEGEVAEAYYFSTSMGYTDTAEVWNPVDEAEIGYLKQVCLNEQEYTGDLSNDEEFKAYLMSETTGCDSDIKFYRWQIQADYSELTDEIKDILKTRREASARHITYYKADGETKVDSMKNFGKFKRLEAVKRSNSGCILELMVHFEKGCVKVENEYNIRKILGCGAEKIIYKDGSTGKGISLIPSAFCTVEKQKDGTYLLYGGGYGHGIGMSQNGANGLAKAGYNYVDILNYFYKDIELVDIRL